MDHCAKGGVKRLLQLEGLAVLLLCSMAYAQYGMALGWGMAALLFFAPDLALLGYAANAKLGAALYNATHSYTGPLLLLAAALALSEPTATAVAIVWTAHIGFDRALGYGLKYAAGFRFTHLGTVGRPADAATTGNTADFP